MPHANRAIMRYPVRRYMNLKTLAELLVFNDRSVRVVAGFGGRNVFRDVSRADAAMMIRRCRAMGHKMRVRAMHGRTGHHKREK